MKPRREPARPVDERRRKQCVLVDVAGMLRSLDYAVHTALSPAGLWRKPLGARRREPRAWARKLRPAVRAAVEVPALRRRMTATFAGHPDRIPAQTARELIMGWVDANDIIHWGGLPPPKP